MTTTTAAVSALRAAVETAQGQWQGLDWSTDAGDVCTLAGALERGVRIDECQVTTWVDQTSDTSRHHERCGRLQRLIAEGEYAEARELAEDLAQEARDYVEGEAARADEHGDLAVAAAERGEWGVALEQLRMACRLERAFGDDPAWGPALVLAERLRAEPDTDGADGAANAPA